ncbi:putative molybdopterin binding domain protein [Mycobacterium ulcerans str. Harvey]|uniref:Molybdopterin molybdenumtransferase n=1 Tax=Mycobacterium ulcerans str. Harvey TaxID=1299332 RepID=A0ABN0R3E7_MYCUL|nr:putative molybdopterin binding domain protein [Mycobacterium ulcerans str. Harvey]
MIPRQRVLVVSTGTELVPPGTPLQPGQIYESNAESNAVMLTAAARDAGAVVVATDTAGDDVAQFVAILDRHAGAADLIITSGASVPEPMRLSKTLRPRRRSGRRVRQGGDATGNAPGRRPGGRHADRDPARQPGQRAGVL